MLWGIDRPEWIQLWSGTVGSFVAAVVGGLVALFVVRLTDRQQRNSARDGRELTAMADLVAATGSMVKKYRDPVAVQDLLLVAEAAAIRWDMNSDVDGLGDEAFRWPYLLGTLALDVFRAGDGPEREAAFDRLSSAQSALLDTVTEWPKADVTGRTALVLGLITSRELLEAEQSQESSDVTPADEANQ